MTGVKIHTVSSALITVWDSGSPTLNDVDATLLAAQQLHARCDKPIALIGVMSPTTRVPVGEVSDRMQANWPKLMDLACTMQYANLGQVGFVRSRLISLVVRLFALTNHGKTLQMHETVPAALEAAARVDTTLFGHIPEMRQVIERSLREIAREAEKVAR